MLSYQFELATSTEAAIFRSIDIKEASDSRANRRELALYARKLIGDRGPEVPGAARFLHDCGGTVDPLAVAWISNSILPTGGEGRFVDKEFGGTFLGALGIVSDSQCGKHFFPSGIPCRSARDLRFSHGRGPEGSSAG